MPKYDPIMSAPLPKDYAEGEEDHDESYNRCPLCTAAIAGVVGGVVIAVLMAAAFAIKEGVKWLM